MLRSERIIRTRRKPPPLQLLSETVRPITDPQWTTPPRMARLNKIYKTTSFLNVKN